MKYFITALIIFCSVSAMAAETTSKIDKDGNMVVTITITPNEQIFLKGDLLSIPNWIDQAIAGKIHKCKSRMVTKMDQQLKADPTVTAIPTDETAYLELVAEKKISVEREVEDVTVIGGPVKE